MKILTTTLYVLKLQSRVVLSALNIKLEFSYGSWFRSIVCQKLSQIGEEASFRASKYVVSHLARDENLFARLFLAIIEVRDHKLGQKGNFRKMFKAKKGAFINNVDPSFNNFFCRFCLHTCNVLYLHFPHFLTMKSFSVKSRISCEKSKFYLAISRDLKNARNWKP